MYVCRTLSYKGAEFEIVEARLEAGMEVIIFYLRLCCLIASHILIDYLALYKCRVSSTK